MIRLLLVLLAGYISCRLLYIFFDTVVNGFFMDWFDGMFLITKSVIDPYTMEEVYVRDLNIYAFKHFLFWALLLFVCLWLVIVFFVSRYKADRQVKAAVTDIGDRIQRYMSGEMDVSDVFPAEYSEVSVRIGEIKSRMQRNEQALKDEAQRKNDLITYLAHDLKTPLTSVIGYLSLLDEAPDMPAEQKAKYVHITLEKALRLEKLINEFFEITRYNLQQMVLEEERIDLSYMLVQMTDEFYPLLAANDNRIELHADEGISIQGDSEKLARVFNNVLKNAIAYSYPGTEINVTAQKTETQVIIAIRNHGKTIPAHKLETIFEKFFRLDEARRSNTGGVGLGLAIAKEIVELHGGSITAESDREVTTFRVSLPCGNIL